MQKKSKSEVGHAKNVANFEDLLVRCTSFGAAYNPPRPELQVSNLQQLHQEAKLTLGELAACEVKEQNATNNRAATFKTIRPLVTRIINTLAACGATAKTMEDARAIQRKLTGVRASKKINADDTLVTAEQADLTTAEGTDNGVATVPRQISASRQSYDLQVEHFARLLLLLQREINYTPNEVDLQLPTLQALEQNLRYLLTTVTVSETETETARIRRKMALYNEMTGLCARAHQVKSYVKAIFGSTSPQYKQISGIQFRNV